MSTSLICEADMTNGTKVQSVALQRTYSMKQMRGFGTTMPGQRSGWHMNFSNTVYVKIKKDYFTMQNFYRKRQKVYRKHNLPGDKTYI